LRLARREGASQDAHVVLLFGPGPAQRAPEKPATAGDDYLHVQMLDERDRP